MTENTRYVVEMKESLRDGTEFYYKVFGDKKDAVAFINKTGDGSGGAYSYKLIEVEIVREIPVIRQVSKAPGPPIETVTYFVKESE